VGGQCLIYGSRRFLGFSLPIGPNIVGLDTIKYDVAERVGSYRGPVKLSGIPIQPMQVHPFVKCHGRFANILFVTNVARHKIHSLAVLHE